MFCSPSHYAILVVVKSLLSISINWSVTTRYYLIFEVINCQREHISEINFDIVKYTAYVWSTRGCHRGGGGATVAWWPGGGKAWWRRWHGGTPAAAMAAARGNLDERKPLFEARNRILWLAMLFAENAAAILEVCWEKLVKLRRPAPADGDSVGGSGAQILTWLVLDPTTDRFHRSTPLLLRIF